MTNLENLQDFYINGNDPNWNSIPNYSFVNPKISGESTILIPGHFYTHTELYPITPDFVPTWDEYEIIKNPSIRDLALTEKYKTNKPYFDNRPIYLALDQYGLGLNIKIISQDLRKKINMSYLRAMSTAIINSYSDGNLIDIRTRISDGKVSPFLRVNYDSIKSFIGIPDFKLSLLINKYNRETMRNLTLIDWDDIPKLHLVNYSTDKTISARSSFSLFEIK